MASIARAAREWEYPQVEPEIPRGLLHHQRFVDDVRFGRYECPSPERGLATLRIVEAAYRAVETDAESSPTRSNHSHSPP